MKIYDCFIYFNEDLLLDLRLNILNKYVDKFVIIESKFTHRGEIKKPNFNLDKFKDFKNKIEYILLEKPPHNLYEIKKEDSKINEKIIVNGNLREFYQRNSIINGLSDAKEEDLIIISDVDEIPNLENIDFDKITYDPYLFNQIFCCYKFNLFSKMRWCGSRMIRKKKLISPQWLRDIKDRNYKKWRLDTLFSKKKYNNIKFIEDGGWHFSYIKSAEEVEKKLLSIRHHIEYDKNPIGVEKIQEMIKNKQLIYNYKVDQRITNKFEHNETLEVLEMNKLPKYIQNNLSKFNKWIEK
jgi:beta-1,4-mannosyl-glycoprotein beta-1,4-N-acetylglucosaminyltransferase